MASKRRRVERCSCEEALLYKRTLRSIRRELALVAAYVGTHNQGLAESKCKDMVLLIDATIKEPVLNA